MSFELVGNAKQKQILHVDPEIRLRFDQGDNHIGGDDGDQPAQEHAVSASTVGKPLHEEHDKHVEHNGLRGRLSNRSPLVALYMHVMRGGEGMER